MIVISSMILTLTMYFPSACQIGYQGENCEQPCPLPTYGENCQSICQCNTNQICHHVYGCIAKDVGMNYHFYH